MPFGRLNDPVGKPTERGLALIPFAQMHELAEDYVMSFMQGVWSEGLDAGTDAHLKIIVERSGLNWQAAKDILRSKSNEQHWRAVAEQNREALLRWVCGVFLPSNLKTPQSGGRTDSGSLKSFARSV